MTRRTRRLVAGLPVLALAIGSTIAGGGASADPLQSARDQAAALAKQVSTLRDRAEAASQRYDAIEEQLATAVSTQFAADHALEQATSSADQQQQLIAQQARRLYEAGGDSSVVASLVTGESPTDALDRYRLTGSVVAYDSRQLTAANQTVAQAAALEARDVAAEHRVTALQRQAGAAADQVQALLAQTRHELRSVSGTVRRLEAAAAAAARRAAAARFNAAVSQAGGNLGSINLKGSIAAPNQVVATAIQAARSRLGDLYVWGGTGPTTFDCSGLTQWSYAHAGIALPRVAAEQWNSGPHPALSDLQPGDLLFWAFDTSNPATIHHVALYIGGGMMIAAPHTGTVVQVQPVYMDGLIGATRPWATR